MKRGFTLVELIAVVIILAIISLIGFSYINNIVANKEKELSDTFNKIVFDATDIYISYNQKKYSMIDGNVYCIKLKELTDMEILTEPLIDPITNEEVSLEKFVELEVNVDEYLYDIKDSCTEKR